MKKSNLQVVKVLVFLGFLIFLFGGTYLMYTSFIKKQPTVDPKSVPYRTKQNPFLVDSLKNAGYYDTMVLD